MRKKGALILLFILTQGLFVFSQNKTTIDSLRILLNASKADTNKVILLSQLCYEYANSDPNEALVYGHLGESLAAQLFFKKGKALCLGKMGMVYYNQGEYENALVHYLQALKINEQIGNKNGVADNLCNIGTVYRTQKKYDKALECQFKALKMDEESGNKYAIASDHTNIGNIYFDAENYQKAMIYYPKALKVFEELSDKQNTATVLNNIGAIYFNRENFQMAIENFNRAIKIYEVGGDKLGVAIDLNNIAEVYSDQKKYEDAIDYYKRSLAIAKEIGAKDIQKYNYNGLSEISAKIKDYSAAYEYHKLYYDVTSALLNSETSSHINEMAIKYETEEKEKENVMLKKENTKQSFLNQHQREIGNYLVMGLIAVSLVGFTFFSRSRRKEKEKENLEKIVSERTSELNFKNKQKELMLQEIHHRVKNNLQLISSLLRLQTNFKGDKDVDEILANCNNRIKCMAILHDKLCQANDYSEINSEEYFTELTSYVSKNYDNANADIKVELNVVPLTLHINKLIPCGLIVNELVSNAYKYAFNEAKVDNFIRITFTKSEPEKMYNLQVADTGKGLPDNFEIESEGGLGLIIVQSLVEQLDGKINFEKDKGTIVNISFPS
jgi:two-component sensor histidine kinase/Tfp pilus assembly protein PilF